MEQILVKTGFQCEYVMMAGESKRRWVKRMQVICPQEEDYAVYDLRERKKQEKEADERGRPLPNMQPMSMSPPPSQITSSDDFNPTNSQTAAEYNT